MPLTTLPAVSVSLKEETRERHLQSEAILTPVLTSLDNRQQYARVLQMFYGFFHPLEQLIAQYIDASVLPDIASRRNSQHILNDLASLGEAGVPIEIANHLPDVSSRASALGALYVMEGSTLGGRMIRKMLLGNPSVGLNEEAVSFFNGYGESTGEKWKAFQFCLNQYADDRAEIVAAANDCFLKFTNWMQHRL